MAFCEGCQRAIDELDRSPAITRGPLQVGRQPPCATWLGRDLRLSSVQAGLLYALARTGEATHIQMGFVTTEGAVKTHVSHLRRIFAAAGAPDLIQNIQGWGYRLNPIYFREVADADHA